MFHYKVKPKTEISGFRGIGPAVLGVFPGGRIEEYIPSRIITNEELCNIQ